MSKLALGISFVAITLKLFEIEKNVVDEHLLEIIWLIQ